jgi:hypothetical protein
MAYRVTDYMLFRKHSPLVWRNCDVSSVGVCGSNSLEKDRNNTRAYDVDLDGSSSICQEN